MNEQNKKAAHDGMDRKKKDDTIIKNGVIPIDAESIVFAKGAFKESTHVSGVDVVMITKTSKVTVKASNTLSITFWGR